MTLSILLSVAVLHGGPDTTVRTCQGLNLADGEIDAAHIYWDHDARRFDDWVR